MHKCVCANTGASSSLDSLSLITQWDWRENWRMTDDGLTFSPRHGSETPSKLQARLMNVLLEKHNTKLLMTSYLETTADPSGVWS